MKIRLYKTQHLTLLIALLLLFACSGDSLPTHWDGSWERRINVPKGMPGSCYDEVLQIEGRKWHLTATIYSTFECKKAFLELGFTADIDEVLIKKGSHDNNVTLKLRDIRMTSMRDVATSAVVELSEKSVALQSAKYVPEKWQQVEQTLLFSNDRKRMSAKLFLPTAALATPAQVNSQALIPFKR